MNTLDYFFRNTPETSNFITFGKEHVLLLLLGAIISFIIIKSKKENRRLELCIGATLLTQQIILYIWYWTSGFNTLTEGLPLYHCRIAIITTGAGLFLNNDKLMKFGASWGIFGSLGALSLPGLDPFIYPHVTQFSYFIGHLFLLWGSSYILIVKHLTINKNELKKITVISTIYHILMFKLNHALNSNYAYMNSPPINIGIELNPTAYGITVIIIFNIALFIEYIIINKKIKKNNLKKTYISDDI